MTPIWIFLIVALVLQETASAAAALALAQQQHLPAIPIHLIWTLGTIFDMYLGFTVGDWLHKKLRNTRFGRHIGTWAAKFEKLFGRYGQTFALAMLAVVNFPYLNTFLASWAHIPKKIGYTATFIGDATWYFLLWGAVLSFGKTSAVATAVILAIVIGVVSHVALKFLKDHA